jgi:hypothetical protein
VLPNTTSHPVLSLDANRPSTEVYASTPRKITSTMAQDVMDTTRLTVATDSETLSPSVVHLPGTHMPPAAADRREGITPVKDAFRGVQVGMTTIGKLSNICKEALERIKWVMEAVSPIAEVRYDVPSANP